MNNPFSPVSLGSNRLVVASWAKRKNGKSHLGLTFPRPIYWIDLDFGVTELTPKFDLEASPDFLRKGLYVPEPDAMSAGDAAKLLTEFRYAWKYALDHCPPGGTVVVDTGTQVWQLVSHVFVDEIEEARQQKLISRGLDPDDPKNINRKGRLAYGPANLEMGGILRRAFMYDCNVYWTHRAKEKYNSQGQPTGYYEPQWWKETDAVFQLVIRIEEQGEGKALKHFGYIEANRFDPTTHGLMIPEPDYEMLHAAVYGG